MTDVTATVTPGGPIAVRLDQSYRQAHYPFGYHGATRTPWSWIRSVTGRAS